MKRTLAILLGLSSFAFLSIADAANAPHRVAQLSNEKVSVWSVVINPGKTEAVPMHRHDSARVLIALNDGVLKVTNDKGQSHELKLKKDQAYYLQADAAGEMHSDENISGHPIKVMVVELR